MRRSRKVAAAAMVGAILCRTAACGGGDDVFEVGEGVSLELAGHRAATLTDVRYRYAMGIPRHGDEPVRGTVEVEFGWDDPRGLPVVLDFVEPEARVQSVVVNGEPSEWRAEADHVLIGPDGLNESARNRVEIVFAAGDGALNRNDDFLYTLFVPDRAHHSVPIFDQPDLKGLFAVTLQVPEGWTGIANGTLAGEDVADGVRTLRFSESRPLPSYLLAFAAGDFDEVVRERAGRNMRFLHRETDTEKVERNLEAIFDLHGTALEWLEEYTGIEYPFGSFGFVAIPSFQYGGMEHPGAVMYRASRLFLEESATQDDRLGRAHLIAHETAHMWFGDLVTMRWFDDVWTKEVFANFFASQIVHPSFPDVDHDLRFLLSHQPTAYGVDRTAGANPIRQPLENLSEAGSLYGAIIYQKAPVVMRQLEALVGPEVFREGMRLYLDRYSYGNATWPELIAILDERTEQDLAGWSGTWVEEPGRPVVSAAFETGSSNLVVRQEDPSGQGRVWPQPLSVLVGRGPASFDTVRVQLLEKEVRAPSSVRAAEAEFVLPDVSGLGYGHMRLDERTREWLLVNLFRIEDPGVRGAALVALHDAMLEGDVDPDAYLGLLLQGTELETDPLLTERTVGRLRGVFWRYLTPERRRERAPEVEGALWEGVLEAADGSEGAVYFRAYRDVALTADATALLRQIHAGERLVPNVSLSEEDRTTLALELALREVDGWSEILDRQAAAIENPDRAARFAFLRPVVDADPEVREAFFESLLEPGNREREPWTLAALGYLNHPLRAQHAERFIQPLLEEVPEVQRTGDIFFPKGWMDAGLSGHATPEAADAVRSFLEEMPQDFPARLREKLLQSADPVFRAARIVHGWD